LAAGPSKDGRPHARRATPAQDVFLPSSWAGQWEFDIEYLDPENGSVVAMEQTATALCGHDPVGLSLLVADGEHPSRPGFAPRRRSSWRPLETECEGRVTDQGLAIDCRGHLVAPFCRLDFHVDVDLHRSSDGNAVDGLGEWRLASSGWSCPVLLEGTAGGGRARMTGIRATPDPGACTAVPQSVIEKLVSQPEVVRALLPSIDDLSARVTGRAVHLAWTPSHDAVAHDVYRAPMNGPYRWVGRVHGREPGRFVDHIPRSGGPVFRYVVRWTSGDGRDAPMSNEVSVAAPPSGSHGPAKGGVR
jgi:hypothetical protein